MHVQPLKTTTNALYQYIGTVHVETYVRGTPCLLAKLPLKKIVFSLLLNILKFAHALVRDVGSYTTVPFQPFQLNQQIQTSNYEAKVPQVLVATSLNL